MGATVVGYCRNLTDELLEDQPGFYNDCKAWGNWMAERENHPEIIEILHDLGCDALLTCITEGVSEDEVFWVTPDQLAEAALWVRELVLNGDPRVQALVESYAVNANNVDPVNDEFVQDLLDVAQIAEFFSEKGVGEMTLE